MNLLLFLQTASGMMMGYPNGASHYYPSSSMRRAVRTEFVREDSGLLRRAVNKLSPEIHSEADDKGPGSPNDTDVLWKSTKVKGRVKSEDRFIQYKRRQGSNAGTYKVGLLSSPPKGARERLRARLLDK